MRASKVLRNSMFSFLSNFNLSLTPLRSFPAGLAPLRTRPALRCPDADRCLWWYSPHRSGISISGCYGNTFSLEIPQMMSKPTPKQTHEPETLGVVEGISRPVPIADAGSVAGTAPGAAGHLPQGTGTLGFSWFFFWVGIVQFSEWCLRHMYRPSGDGPQRSWDR